MCNMCGPVEGKLFLLGFSLFTIIYFIMAFISCYKKSRPKYYMDRGYYNSLSNKQMKGGNRKMGIIEELENNWKGYAIAGILAYFLGNKKMRSKLQNKVSKIGTTLLGEDDDEEKDSKKTQKKK